MDVVVHPHAREADLTLTDPQKPFVLTAPPENPSSSTCLDIINAGLFRAVPASDEAATSLHALITGMFALVETRSAARGLIRPAALLAQTPLDVFAVRLQVSGTLDGQAGEKSATVHAGSLLLLDMRQTCDLTPVGAGREAHDVTLWVPRRKMLAAISRDELLHGLVVPGASLAGAVLGGALRLLAEQALRASRMEMDALCDGILALMGKALAPGLNGLGASATPGASFTTIRRHIDQHLHQPGLNADSLAQKFGLSRASLYRLFEPAGGVALHIRKARLNRAYQEIVGSEGSGRRIGPIAFSLGFRNVSAFNRLFKAHYGVTPGQARARTGAVESAPAAAPANAETQNSLAFWLARIGAPSQDAAMRKPE
ncbi:helix-turn-helix domain-containing protein [Rhodoblastus sp.]|uniref:helix-turn-helix domain-containing protein n=1 Tax=Rhodoblastus sp. TaxID=1962975 RepID=UPI0035B4C51A